MNVGFRGRALDTAPPAMYTLLEINKLCPEVLKKCEVSVPRPRHLLRDRNLGCPAWGPTDSQQVYIDGGIRRGTDVIKALCLGAKGVGLGRPFLYSLTYGQEGVVHAIESASLLPSLRPS